MRARAVFILLLAIVACTASRRTLKPVTTPLALDIPAWAWADTSLHANIPYDNPLTVQGVALGRALFYEQALSGNGSMACSSCHAQAFAFSDPQARSRGMSGAIGLRNAPAVQNLAWDHFFFWDARALSVELQAFEPVRGHTEMNSSWMEACEKLRTMPRYPPLFTAAFGDARIDSMRIAFALAQFERTLISMNSKYDDVVYNKKTVFTPTEQRGRDLFFARAHCVDCHQPPLFNGHDVVNIGLDSVPIDPGLGGRTHLPWHMGRFKTPSLRNCEVTAPYMHDGRFATLEQVVDFYADDVHTSAVTLDPHMQPWVRGEVRLSKQDRTDLVAFLRTLTDTLFLGDPRFAAPGP